MEKMVEIDPLENVASRLNELMEFFLMRPGANEALEKELSLKK